MNYIKKGIQYITNSDYRFKINALYGFYNYLSDEMYLKRMFKAMIGNELDLEIPQTFNEKLQWLKLYDRKPEYIVMVDKYKVREYISEKIGEEYLIPLLGVWDRVEDVDFDALPNQFVLKCNHNSGLGMCICKDKSKLDIAKVKRELRKGLEQDYFLTGREWPYKNVPRKIIAEKYMVDSGVGELRDYKFFCFGGVCKCMKVDFDRFIEHRANYFDVKGNLLDLGEIVCPPDKSKNIILPKNMQNMVKLAEKLSENQPFLRVDFYDVDEQVYFGELTFFPASGFGTFVDDEQDLELGKWIELPQTCGGGYICLVGEHVLLLQKTDTQGRMHDESLTDYKFYCFNGKVDAVMLCIDRYSETEETKFYFFDQDWNLKRYNGWGKRAPEGFTLPKPDRMDEMFKIAETLSEGIPFVRVDLYNVGGHPYFGELTFYPSSGFDKGRLREFDLYMGSLVDLNKVSKK